MRRLLAIDPGPVESAYVVWDGVTVLDHGKVLNSVVRSSLGTRIEFREINYCAIEMIASYGMPVGAEIFETCVWIGRFMEIWEKDRAIWTFRDTIRITRNEIKNHLCHSSKAKDSNIRQALIDRLGAPGTKKAPGITYGLAGDEWAALAVAVTVWDKMEGRA